MFLDVSNGFADVGDTIEYPTGRGVIQRIVIARSVDGGGGIHTTYNIAVKPNPVNGYSRRVHLHNPQRIALVNP
jgi:hypothetical protein